MCDIICFPFILPLYHIHRPCQASIFKKIFREFWHEICYSKYHASSPDFPRPRRSAAAVAAAESRRQGVPHQRGVSPLMVGYPLGGLTYCQSSSRCRRRVWRSIESISTFNISISSSRFSINISIIEYASSEQYSSTSFKASVIFIVLFMIV